MANIRTNIVKTNIIAPLLVPQPHIKASSLQTKTDAPAAHSALLSSHPPGAPPLGTKSDHYWSPSGAVLITYTNQYWSQR